MGRGLLGVLGVLGAGALGLACQGRALQPPDGGAAAGTTGAAGAGGGDLTGSGGETGQPDPCRQIATDTRIFNPCGRTYSLAYSPDGQFLAAGLEAARPNVRLWRLSDGALVRAIDAAADTTYRVVFSPDGKLLATAGGFAISGSGTGTFLPEIVKLWSVADGALVRTIPARCGSYADAAAFSHDGTMLVTAGASGPVEVWRVADGSLVASIPYPTSVHNASFSPDDTKVIVAGVDRRATIWDLRAAALMMTLDGIADEMADAVFSPAGGEIATTADHGVAVWNEATGAVSQMLSGHDQYVSHVLWVGTSMLVSNDWSGTVKTWFRSEGQFRQSGELKLAGQSLGIAIAPDQQTAVVGGFDPSGAQGFVFFRP